MCSLVVNYGAAVSLADGAYLSTWQPQQLIQQRQRFIKVLQSLLWAGRHSPIIVPDYLLKIETYLTQGFSVLQSYQLLNAVDQQKLVSDIKDPSLLKKLLQCNWNTATCDQELLQIAKEHRQEPLLQYLVTAAQSEVVREQAKNKLLALQQQGPWSVQLYQTIASLPDHVFSWQGMFGLGAAFAAERWVGNILVQQGVRSIAKIQSVTFVTENLVFSGLGTVQLYAEQDLVKENVLKLWGVNLITLGLLRLSRWTSEQVQVLIHQPAVNGMALRAWEWQSLTRAMSENTLGLLALIAAPYFEYQVVLRPYLPSWHAAFLQGVATHIAAQGAGAIVHPFLPMVSSALALKQDGPHDFGKQFLRWGDKWCESWLERYFNPDADLQFAFIFANRKDTRPITERFQDIYKNYSHARGRIDKVYEKMLAMGWPEAQAQAIIVDVHKNWKTYRSLAYVIEKFEAAKWPHELQWQVLNTLIHTNTNYPHTYRLDQLGSKIRQLNEAEWTPEQQAELLRLWAKRKNDHLSFYYTLKHFKAAGWSTQDQMELSKALLKHAGTSMRYAMRDVTGTLRYFTKEKIPVKKQKQLLLQLAAHTKEKVHYWFHAIPWQFAYMKKQQWSQQKQMDRYLELSESQPQKPPANREL